MQMDQEQGDPSRGRMVPEGKILKAWSSPFGRDSENPQSPLIINLPFTARAQVIGFILHPIARAMLVR